MTTVLEEATAARPTVIPVGLDEVERDRLWMRAKVMRDAEAAIESTSSRAGRLFHRLEAGIGDPASQAVEFKQRVLELHRLLAWKQRQEIQRP